MEYKKDVKRLSLNGHGTGKPERQKHAAVPTTLLPAVLSHLGLAGRPMAKREQTVAALRDEQSPVRVAAVHSLGERREASLLPLLVSALHDPAWEVRAAAVWALSAFGEYAPVEALLEALADEDGSVRAAALRVLSSMRGQLPPESLTRLLHDADRQIREAAALTVEELGEQAPPGPSVAGRCDENEAQGEAAQMPPEPSHPEVLPLAFPSLPLTVQRATQLEVLGDRYQLQDPIGRGGMATIYRGRDMRMKRVVAIKALRELYNTEPKFVKRFEREAKAASALHHPNIVQVFDYGQTDGNYYLVMELVEGTELRRYLRSRGVLDSKRAIIIAHDVALGLGAAHRRAIVHRDVKPQNILVCREGSIKLTDFGIASVYQNLNASRLTTTGMTLGTVEYMPPEQAQGDIVSPAADVYALGIVMYEMLTGRTPFDGNTAVVVAMQHIQDAPRPPSQFNPHISPALEEIILRCLEKVPEMRYRDGSQLARALESLSDAEFAETTPSTTGPQQAPGGQIPARPVNSGRAAARGEQPPTSLPNPVLPVSVSTVPDGGSPVPVPVVASQPPLHLDQPQSYVPPIVSSESSSTRPYAHGGAQSQNRRDSRSASVVTALILLATLLLLGFSIYLAIQLGFISIPAFNNGGVTATPAVVNGTVPDLRGDDWATAQKVAQGAGFKLALGYGQTSQAGVVIQQNPDPGNPYQKGMTIDVKMGPKPSPSPSLSPSSSPTPLPTSGPSPTPT